MTQNACVLFTLPTTPWFPPPREGNIPPQSGRGTVVDGGGGQNGGKSIRVKIAKARAHWNGPQFYPLQENQGFFATHFFTKMKKFFGGFPPFFNFANCPKLVAKKPWFFYDVHE